MIGFGWARTYLGDVFIENICVLLCFGWLDFWKIDQKRKIWAIVGGPSLRRRDPLPQRSNASPRCSREEDFSSLGFTAAKPLFTAWKCYVFVSLCFSVVLKTCILD